MLLTNQWKKKLFNKSPVLLEGKWRLAGCCCFSLRTGCNILGILEVIGAIFEIWFIEVLLLNDDKNSSESMGLFLQKFRESLPFPITNTTKGLMCAHNVVAIPIALAMLYGNVKAKKNLMLPYVYLIAVGTIAYTIAHLIAMFERFGDGKGSEGFGSLLSSGFTLIAGLFICQVGRCRMVEIAESVRPMIPFTQVHPNAPPPAYGEAKTNSE